MTPQGRVAGQRALQSGQGAQAGRGAAGQPVGQPFDRQFWGAGDAGQRVQIARVGDQRGMGQAVQVDSFTRFGGLVPRATASAFVAAIVAILERVATVAEAMCGAIRQFGNEMSG